MAVIKTPENFRQVPSALKCLMTRLSDQWDRLKSICPAMRLTGGVDYSALSALERIPPEGCKLLRNALTVQVKSPTLPRSPGDVSGAHEQHKTRNKTRQRVRSRYIDLKVAAAFAGDAGIYGI